MPAAEPQFPLPPRVVLLADADQLPPSTGSGFLGRRRTKEGSEPRASPPLAGMLNEA